MYAEFRKDKTLIARIWKGWTSLENAAKYERLFKEEILPRVTQGIDGHISTNLLRRANQDEVEFTTIFWFESMDAVKQFAGEHFHYAVVPDEVRKLMTRFEESVQHHEAVL